MRRALILAILLGEAMTTQKIKAKLAEIEAEAKIADKLVCDLAAGTKKWQMCVPPQDDDTDIMLVKQVRETIPNLLATLSDMIEAVEAIASKHKPRHETEEYWIKISHEQCATVLATDTKIARAALDRAAERFRIIEKGET